MKRTTSAARKTLYREIQQEISNVHKMQNDNIAYCVHNSHRPCDGRVCMTEGYMVNPQYNSLELFTEGDPVEILNLEIYELASIWN